MSILEKCDLLGKNGLPDVNVFGCIWKKNWEGKSFRRNHLISPYVYTIKMC